MRLTTEQEASNPHSLVVRQADLSEIALAQDTICSFPPLAFQSLISPIAVVVMENTTQTEQRSDSADQQVELKQKKCLPTQAVRIAAVLVGISLAAIAVLPAYAADAFDSNPDLPEIMEGEATFTADDGKGEVFHVMIDYKRGLIQLTSLNDLVPSPQLFGRRLMSFEGNKTANGTRINATKIVTQDYNAVSSKSP